MNWRLVVAACAAACLLAAFSFLAPSSARGQSVGYAALSGRVTDTTGAVVPGVRVTATNVATNVAESVTTNAKGLYTFPPTLQPGNYAVKFEKAGFQTVVQANVSLHAEVMQVVSVTLKVGKITQTVTVTGTPTALQTMSASLAQLVPTKAIANLPLLGLLPYDLLTVGPGVTGTGTLGATPNTTNDVVANGQYLNINAGGRSYESNLFMLNGSNVTDTPVGGSAAAAVLPDALAEMRVSTNDYDAQYGGQAGEIINSTTKSGTNQFHGDVFEYHMDSALSSRSVFQSTPSSVYPWRRNEFGGTVGGPILRNRLFLFGSLDILRSSGAGSGIYTFETPQFASFVKTAFPNSVAAKTLSYAPESSIKLSNVETLAQYYQNNPGWFYPTLSTAEALGFPANLPVIGTGTWTPTGRRHGYYFSVRPDYYFNNQRDHLYFYAQKSHDHRLIEDPRPAFGQGYAPFMTFAANINETHTFGPSLVNESYLGYYRTSGGEYESVGPALEVPGTDILGIYGYNGGGFPFWPATYVQNVTNWNDMLTLIKGEHSIHMGYGVRRWEDNANFTGAYTIPIDVFFNLVDFSQDQPFESTEQGVNPQTGKATSQDRDYRGTEMDAFINDKWRLTPDLTLNLGLRWDYFGNPTEAQGMQENFILGPGSTLAEQVAGGKAEVVPTLFANARYDNFAPRFGFAWNPAFDKKFVLRGGYGIFYDRPSNQIYTNNRTNMPLFAVPTFGVPTGTPINYGYCTAISSNNVDCPESPALNTVSVNSAGGLVGVVNGTPTIIPTTQTGTSRQFPIAYSENWNLGVQYAITPTLISEIDYIGDVSHANYLSTDVNRVNGDFNPVTGVLSRPNPNFADVEFSRPIGYSNFNALSVGLKRNAPHGIVLAVFYTWSHAFDECSDYLEDNCGIPEISNISANYGPSNFDVRNRVAGYMTWRSPNVFRSSRLASDVFSRWRLSPVVTLQSGMPFTVTCNGAATVCDYNLDGYGNDRPSIHGSVHLVSSSPSPEQYLSGIFLPGNGQFGTQFYAPAGFGTPTYVPQEGNLGRNTFRGPGLADVDFALSRRFQLNERLSLVMGAQAFNLFNRVNLANPDGGMADPTFGQSTSLVGNPRAYQFYAKIWF